MLKIQCSLLSKKLLCMLEFGQIGLHLYSCEEWHEFVEGPINEDWTSHQKV